MQIDNKFRDILNVLPGDKALAQLIKVAQNLDLGQFLNAKVVKVLPDNKAVVNIQGQNITLETDVPLTQGQTFLAKIEQKGADTTIKLAATDGNTPIQARIADKPQPQLPEKTVPAVVTRFSQLTIDNAADVSESPLPEKILSPDAQPNQVIQVKIIRLLDDKTLQVEFQGKQFPVQIQSEGELPGFIPGQEVSLRLGGEKGGLVFAVPVAETPKVVDAAMIKPYLASKQDMGQMVDNLQKNIVNQPLLKELKIDPSLLGRLRDTLRVLSPQEDSPPDAARLKEQADRSGTSYEAKVRDALSEPLTPESRAALSRDLKGQLLELQNKLETVSRRDLPQNIQSEIKEMLQNVKQSVDSIEFRQLSNQFAKQENNPVLIQIPDPFNSQNQAARLYFRNDSKDGVPGRDGKKDFNLVFLLDMTALGNLRIDARLNGNDLSAKIIVEDRNAADHIDSQTGELLSRLREMGFISTVSCEAHEKVDMQAEEDLRRMLVEDKSRLIDIKT